MSKIESVSLDKLTRKGRKGTIIDEILMILLKTAGLTEVRVTIKIQMI